MSGALVAHHMGHVAERSRGDSRIRDWPDVEWRLMRQDDKDDASPRFLSAYGRDVDVPETQITFDPQTRGLVAVGGSRRDAKAAVVLEAVLAELRGAGRPLSGRALEDRLDGAQPRDGVREALRLGVCDGVLVVEEGPRNAHLYTPSARARGSARTPSPAHTSECAALFIEPRTRALAPLGECAETETARSLPAQGDPDLPAEKGPGQAAAGLALEILDGEGGK